MSTARKLSRADRREIEAAIAKANRTDKKRKSAQDSIPFQRMFPDGICRVTDSYYTKTVQFQDINYQLNQNEDKTAIFDGWCDFLNYFDSSVRFQLSFINMSANKDTYGKRISIPLRGDLDDSIRAEYTQMLRNQLSKGNNGLIKTKYLTFGVEAETLKAAKPRLDRIETDILNNFKRLGVSADSMNGMERLKIMHGMFHMDDQAPFRFSWDWLAPSGLSPKDFIAPSSFEFRNGNSFGIGKKLGAVSFLQILAPELNDRMLADFLDMESSLVVTMHVQSVDQVKAIKTIKRKITDLDKMKIEEQKKAIRSGYDMDIIPSDLATYGTEAKKLLQDLQSRNERMFLLTFIVLNVADSKQQLDNNIFQASSIAQKYNCQLTRLDFRQEEGLMSVDAMNERFEEVEFQGKTALFTDCRVARDTVPEGLHRYEIRHTDDDWGEPCQLGYGILVNHFGTLITNEAIQLDPSGHLDFDADAMNFLGTGYVSIMEYMESHPPVEKTVFEIFPIDEDKTDWLYSDESKDGERGVIGHLRGDFGSGKEFWTTWWPHNDDKQGRYVNCVLYGYKRSASEKHQMVIDEVTAPIVRRVFNDIICGKSTTEVAKSLNDEHIPTPAQYKGTQRGHANDLEKAPRWTHNRILEMIRNIKYTGTMVNHTRESRYIRDKNQRRVPQDEWVVRENAHEAIVSQEEYQAAQDAIRKVKGYSRTPHDTSDCVFYCGHCGHKLRKTFGSDTYFSCSSAVYQEYSKCSEIKFGKTEIEDVIFSALKAQVSLLAVQTKCTSEKLICESFSLRKTLERLQTDIDGIDREKFNRYEDYHAGEISAEAFLDEKERLNLRQSALKEELSKTQLRYDKCVQQEESTHDERMTAKKLTLISDDELRVRMYALIDKITVYANDDITISWKFDAAFADEKNTAGSIA